MAEQKHTAGGVEVTTGDKSTGTQALESTPVLGNAVKAADAAEKLTDGDVTRSELQALQGEASGFIQSCAGTAMGIAADPIGWLVGQGLNFLISVVGPIQDAIHWVSGDGPALSQAAENFNAIGEGLTDLRDKFREDLESSLSNWGGDAAEAAGTKLGEFAKGIDGVAGQAGEIAQLLQMSSMVMTVIEDFIKAILTELVTWLIMIWIPALAAAVPTAGASTAAAGASTTARVATTGSRVARMVARLRKLLDDFLNFLRSLRNRASNFRDGFRRAMEAKRTRATQADNNLADASKLPWKQPMDKLRSTDGMIGERVQQGFWQSMGSAAGDTAAAQVGAGVGTNAGADKVLRNQSNLSKGTEYDRTGDDQSAAETEDYLDI